MSTYFAILTEMGEAKLANAIALGQTLKLKNLAVGDGNGNLPMPVRTQKALVREVRRAGLNQLTIDPTNTSQIIVEQVLPEDVGGWWIREIGIFDEAGDLCAVANCPPSYKPLMAEGSGRTQVVRIVLIVASTAAIELKIDPSIILATRKYVDDQDIIVRAYSDAQLAKHLAAADPHPLLAKVAYVDQQNTSARSYGDQQLARHQAALDPHPLLAKVAYVDQQDTSARAYGDQQLAKHQAAVDPHPLLAKVAYVDQQDTNARTYGDQQLAKHQAAADAHPLLARTAYVDQQNASARAYIDQQDTSARTYGDQQLAKHQAALDPHPLLAKVAYVDQQDASARTYGDQQLAKHQAAVDPHPLLAKIAYVDQQDTSARTYGDQQLAKHQAAVDPHPLLAKVAYVDQQDTSARAYGDQQLAKHAATADPHPQYRPKELIVLNKSVAGKVDVVLTEAEAKADVLHFTGALTGHINVIVPTAARSWTVRNKTTGAYALTLKTAAGSGLAIGQGQTRAPYCDGVDVLSRMTETDTPPQFDASSRLANMQAVQRALGNFKGQIPIAVSRALLASEAGGVVNASATLTLAMPPSAQIIAGAAYQINNSGSGVVTVQASAGDFLYGVGNGTARTFSLGAGDTLCVAYVGGTQWYAWGGAQLGASASFASQMAVPGFQRLPSGLLLQWGMINTSNAGPALFTFPAGFPNMCLAAWGTGSVPGGEVANVGVSNPSRFNCSVSLRDAVGNFYINPVSVFAIGH